MVGMVTLSSQLQDGSQGMKNLEGAQDKPPQTRGMSEESQDKPPQTRGNSSLGPCGPCYASHVVLDTK